jgi:orotate phosphoribosyltransferase
MRGSLEDTGEAIYQDTKSLDFDVVGCTQESSVPLVVAVLIAYYRHNLTKDSFFIHPDNRQSGHKALIVEYKIDENYRLPKLDVVIAGVVAIYNDFAKGDFITIHKDDPWLSQLLPT